MRTARRCAAARVAHAAKAHAAKALLERAHEQHVVLKRRMSVRRCADVRACMTDGFWHGCADHVVRTARSPYGMQPGSEQRLLDRLLGPATMNRAQASKLGLEATLINSQHAFLWIDSTTAFNTICRLLVKEAVRCFYPSGSTSTPRATRSRYAPRRTRRRTSRPRNECTRAALWARPSSASACDWYTSWCATRGAPQ